ncbi:glycosyltransferase [Halomicroarcula sp. F28]|uniref:glycosyltransferase family 2 protein n=1 Tax=Haloarcula salinisoli TaxID=2487746 RepID=UPI001C7341CF|nr:glycosyltransferase [Halomicroarcula salinisoli]MBX0285922.1 glycosyltransferase [Halomicroarcula salinisoli]
MTSVASVVDAINAFGLVAIAYFALLNANYLLIHVLALWELRSRSREASWEPPYDELGSPFLPGIAILVPAYNEAATIEESVRSFLTLEYTEKEIIVVNDGSTDGTLAELQSAYDLVEMDAEIPFDVPSEPITAVYRSMTHENLTVVDKANGGKSDALNAGLWLTDKELFCAVDADTIIDRDALLKVVTPFLERPETIVASGGTVRVANQCTVEHGQIRDVRMPTNPVVGLQVMEYLRAFYSGRLGLDRLRSLIIISGAFGVFKTDLAREIGGYREETVTEDFEFVVRIHRHLVETGQEYAVEFVPEPVAWTQVPETLSVLGRQRRRWYRGMVETLVMHRDMIGRPKYGRVGLYALPFFLFVETIGRLMEGLGYLLLVPLVLLGLTEPYVFAIFFLLTSVFGVGLSWFSIYSEVSTYRRYGSVWQTVLLLWYGTVENIGFRQWKAYIAWRGLFEYLAGVDSWGRMERSGFESHDRDPEDSAEAGKSGDPSEAGKDPEVEQ